MTADGLIACVSKFGPKETMDRLAAAVTARGISIMARTDHAAARNRYGVAADRSSDLREPAGGHAVNAGCTDRRD